VFDHVTIRVSDREASERFYETVLRTLGIERTYSGDELAEWDEFSLAAGRDVTRRLHIGFAAASHDEVDAFWRAGVDAGFRDDGAPGPRPQYVEDYYGSFLLDPDGNSAEAVWHGEMLGGMIDHLWIRVADVEASARFYETIAPHADFSQVRRFNPEHAQCVGAKGTFSLVAGEPTEHVHMAFPGGDSAVEAFHRAATSAGYRDHGAPGERPEYHPGYYAAYVLDPDGNNIEVVNHNRGAV
jgi:catechol 2,3-dioxygenase-like lactoylglutathione lyase family enzyme